MTVRVLSEQKVLQEVIGVLLEHLSLAKVVRFWVTWQVGGGNYLAIREQLFAEETVTTLFEKVQAYQRGEE